jgi:retron-type reverse transcriptase
MKRVGNIYEKICSVENLNLADLHARKGKCRSIGVRIHDRHRDENIAALHQALKNKVFKTSPYHVFTIHDPKRRKIYQLPYYPDRIVHHAIMNVLEPIWMTVFTSDTYACIKGRGIHGAARKLRTNLKDIGGTSYCLKIDIRKFYPNIDHDILKLIIRRKLKDPEVLWLLDSIIDSAPGVPIGNYLSQYFANLYLAYFDHWIKEVKNVQHYYRYADDIVILSDNKISLHNLFAQMQEYLRVNLKLIVKGNYQIFPVNKRGIDFIGYRFYHTYTLLRKSIKQSFARSVKRSKNCSKQVHAAYWGWAKYCNSINLMKKLSA